MHTTFSIPSEKANLANNKLLVFAAIVIPLLYVFTFKMIGFDRRFLLPIILLPLIVPLLLNIFLLLVAIVGLLFIPNQVNVFPIVVVSVLPLVASYFLTYKFSISKDAKNPLIFPIFIYVLLIIPSYFNSRSLTSSVISSFNLVAMISMIVILGKSIKSHWQIKILCITFVSLALINGLFILSKGYSSNERFTGFVGIIFVDFVCIAILANFAFIFYSRKLCAIPSVAISIVLFVSLLFTQTRNTIISLILASAFFVAYLYKNNKAFSINRKQLSLLFIVALICMSVLVLGISLFLPEVFIRIKELGPTGSKTGASGAEFVSNSLISRFLIWHTAISAFLQHPIIGIGAFSFPYDSQYYSKLPIMLYKLWVKGLSPHVAYLAVLTETGILGFIGFLIFVISTIRLGLKSIIISTSKEQKYYSLGICTMQMYIILSMCMTDAWLWGRCGMLWSIVLGISVANYKIVSKSIGFVK